ncbi:MAG: Flp pilus assembly protein CpaB [Desulfobaccales bacterium]
MKLPRGILYVVAAVVAGLLAVVGVNQYVSMKTKVVKKATTPMVVAAQEITPGTALSSSLVKTVAWPQDLVPQGAPPDFGAIKDRVVIVPVNKGEPILMNKLAPEGTLAGLGGILGDGKRAISVRVDDVSGNAGFIKPGDHVDVLMSMQVPNADEEHYSRTILQNIVVLSSGQIWEQQQQDQKPVVVKTVTLEVTPEQGEILDLASNQGKIRLLLRSRNNLEVAQTKGIVTSQLVNVVTPKSNPVTVTVAPQKREATIEVIKGMDRSKASM